MAAKAIPEQVRVWANKIVAGFNERGIRDPERRYVTRYRGRHLYLDRFNYGRSGPICRLTYTGDMDQWEFAIYKYSDNCYDPDEFFPGVEHVDGTIEGAMKAGLEAYS